VNSLKSAANTLTGSIWPWVVALAAIAIGVVIGATVHEWTGAAGAILNTMWRGFLQIGLITFVGLVGAASLRLSP